MEIEIPNLKIRLHYISRGKADNINAIVTSKAGS